MALEFDISGDPPPLAEIHAERERAAADRAMIRRKSIRALIYVLMFGAAMISFGFLVLLPVLNEPDAEPTFVAVIAYFVPYLIFPAFVIGNRLFNKHCEKPRKILDATIAGLKDATADELAEINGAEQDHPEIAAYLQRVSARGRPLVKAEIDAILKWLEKNEPDE